MRKFEAIRNEIIELSKLQKVHKPQRKQECVNRTVGLTPSDATHRVQRVKYELRHLFQAYAILKGIERTEIKKPSNFNGLLLDEKKVQEMVEKFTPIEVEQDAVAS